MPSTRSRLDMRVRVSHGSSKATKTVASAMQVAPTEAFDNLIEP